MHRLQHISIFVLGNVNKRTLQAMLAAKKKVGDEKLLSECWPRAVLLDVFIMKNMLLYFVIYTFQTILERNNAVKIRKIDFIFKQLWCLESYPKNQIIGVSLIFKNLLFT